MAFAEGVFFELDGQAAPPTAGTNSGSASTAKADVVLDMKDPFGPIRRGVPRRVRAGASDGEAIDGCNIFT